MNGISKLTTYSHHTIWGGIKCLARSGYRVGRSTIQYTCGFTITPTNTTTTVIIDGSSTIRQTGDIKYYCTLPNNQNQQQQQHITSNQNQRPEMNNINNNSSVKELKKHDKDKDDEKKRNQDEKKHDKDDKDEDDDDDDDDDVKVKKDYGKEINDKLVVVANDVKSQFWKYFEHLKRLSKELSQQSYNGVVSYYSNYRYINDFIKQKQLNNIPLTRFEAHSLKQFRKDTIYFIPLFIYLAIPFSTFGLPLYIKYLSSYLPTTFSTREMIVNRQIKDMNYKVKCAKKLLKRFNSYYQSKLKNITESPSTPTSTTGDNVKLQNSSSSTLTSTSSSTPNKYLTLLDLERSDVILLSKCLGIKFAILQSTSSLITKIQQWEKETIQENKLILREGMHTLSFEDLQDISFERGIDFNGKSYDQLMNQLSQSLIISSAPPPTRSSYSLLVVDTILAFNNTKDNDIDNEINKEKRIE